jgi:hypothetical protein
MKLVLSFLFALFIVMPALTQDGPIEEGWKNIRVFETKRDEIEKRFGKPTSLDDGLMIYNTADGNLVVVYSEGPCVKSTFGRGIYKVERGTVIDYEVYFKQPLPLLELKRKPDDYSRRPDDHRIGVITYFHREGGIWITAFERDKKELVSGLWFMPTFQQKKHYSCDESKRSMKAR